jgi:hypothetical protein
MIVLSLISYLLIELLIKVDKRFVLINVIFYQNLNFSYSFILEFCLKNFDKNQFFKLIMFFNIFDFD